MSQARLATLTCYVAFLLLGMCTLIGTTYQNLAQRFNMPLSDAGIFTSLQFFGAAIAVAVAGRLLDRLPARYLLCSGAFLIGAGLLLLAGASALPLALVGSALLGLGYGVLDVSPNVVVASLAGDRAGSALNALNVFFCIGAIGGPQLVNFALGQQNFTLAYTLTAMLAFLLIIPFSMISVRVSTQSKEHAAPRPSIRWITLLPFAVLLFVYLGIEIGFSAWIFTQLTTVAVATAATGTIAASVFWAGMGIGRALSSVVLRWIADEQLLLLATVVIGAGVLPLLILPTVEGAAVISAFVVGFGCGPIFPSTLAIVNNRFPEARGTASGVLMAIGTFGGFVFPWLQGQIGGGANGGMILVLGLAVILLGLVVAVQRQMRLDRVTA
jgi:MFS transporter, FHS family, glucose/mannose:H+ symporter